MCLREESMTTVLCGVVTGGDSLCRIRDDHPAFYTRVSEYREWIRKSIDGMDEWTLHLWSVIKLNILLTLQKLAKPVSPVISRSAQAKMVHKHFWRGSKSHQTHQHLLQFVSSTNNSLKI